MVWCALRLERTDGRRWQVLACVAYAVALLAFVKALLAPLLVVVLLYIVPRAGRSLREVPARVREHGVMWVGVLVLTAGYLVVISGDRYYTSIREAPSADAGAWASLLVRGWGEGILPLGLGQVTRADASVLDLATIAVAAILTGALVVGTVLRRGPAALGAWLGVLAVGTGALVASGGARLSTLGVDGVALDPRYPAEGAIALVLVACALLAPRAAERTDDAAAPRAARSRAPVLGLGAAVLLVAVLAAARADGALKQDWPGARIEAWFDDVRAALRRTPSSTLVDGPVPQFVVPAQIVGQNSVSQVVPLVLPDASIGVADRRPLLTLDAGAVRLDPAPVVRESRARLLTDGRSQGLDARGCIAPGAAGTIAVGIEAPSALHVLRLATRPAPRPINVTVGVSSALPTQTIGRFTIPGAATYPSRVPAGVPGLWAYAGIQRTAFVSLVVAAGAPPLCVERIDVGSVDLAGRPLPSRSFLPAP